ncbi:MAG: adenylate cyclase [Gammaproteobacteria bacterium]|jgi:adenylate cyclase
MALVGENLNASARSFDEQITVRNTALAQAGRILSADFAFKKAFASGSNATISSALDNHRHRIGASVILLLSLKGEVITGSGRQADKFKNNQGMFTFYDFFTKGVNTGEGSGMVSFNDTMYSVISVPLLTPVPAAWIVLGFEIDENIIRQFQQDSHAEISILRKSDDAWFNSVSTLPDNVTVSLLEILNQSNPQTDTTINLLLEQTSYFSYISNLSSSGDRSIYAVLQRDSTEALSPYYRLRLILIGLLLVALIISILAGGTIASSVSRPVLSLVDVARQIQQGNYNNRVAITQKDELGLLETAFNEMSKGLHERDKVKNLLGKVISPQIAEELISKDLHLGGEEREMTILFSDLRGFTSFSEKRPPTQVLTILNEYLTKMTTIIDSHGGVVDKYIGDAIMALFGAPLEMPGHAEIAVKCAIEMTEALHKLNIEFKERGWPDLRMGIGVNTGNVVVGNMGSRDRLNYTVIGDNVNLASRLEAVTKEYKCPIIVSETTRDKSTNIEFKKLDRIKVKGKQVAVTIYTPVLTGVFAENNNDEGGLLRFIPRKLRLR